ncbi:putative von Willebrand factor A domain-containing protein 3A [Apostichopus japonicus]|uniref:Putative von Willebrand factor A domain-containing protein 3A n=1 Tax=Stichopus japonicus TaxID=307972 RepID=A0A2G8LJQ3_STIJA|nr:putative von Willebrand factor A domain-containing protein 3A [Apostichopus japonicus]
MDPSEDNDSRPGSSATYEALGYGADELMNLEEEAEMEGEDEELMPSKRAFMTQPNLQSKGRVRKGSRKKLIHEDRPAWEQPSTDGATPTSDLYVTHINQTHDKVRARDMSAMFNEGQSSEDWLGNHSIEHFKLTLKDLLGKGQVVRSIEMYHNRIRWLLKGSKKTFGMVKGKKVAVVLDSSDANCGFGRLSIFREALLELIDEQLHNKEMLYFLSFGSSVDALWNCPRFTNIRLLDEARRFVANFKGTGGCNLLAALKKVLQMKDIDSIVLVLGNCPDQKSEHLVEFTEQKIAGWKVPLHCVAFDCNNHLTNMTLRKLAEISGGRYHVYASSNEEQIYTGTDIALLLREIKTAQDVINKIQQMRQGMMGDALISILNEISLEVQKLPQSRFLPRPPNHAGSLVIEEPSFLPKTSAEWLQQNGLKAKKLSLYQVLAPNAFAPIEQFIPIIRKSVRSQTHEHGRIIFQLKGSLSDLRHREAARAMVKLYERRIDWLSKDSRRLFGTVVEKKIVILVDLSLSNINYLVHIQHSLRLLLEQQLINKVAFNIIGFGSEAHCWRPCLQEPVEKNLQNAWRWILGLECTGSRNLMSAIRLALENEEDRKKSSAVEGLYLFTSGIPDQPSDVICSFMEEATVGVTTRLHSIFQRRRLRRQRRNPGRYANITQTAECLRTLAHISGGRFHWFRETGIIESDDVKYILSEMDKAVNYSQKCAMLVESVKKRSNKYQIQDNKESEEKKSGVWRPTSGKKYVIPSEPYGNKQKAENDQKNQKLCKAEKVKAKRAVFYTEQKNDVGLVFREYKDPLKKRKWKPINHPVIPDKEEISTSKEWLKKYCLVKLRLDLNKLVAGADCTHAKRHVNTLNKTVPANSVLLYATYIFFTVSSTLNVQKGSVKHLQLQAHELRDYEQQLESVLRRYLRRLQWLLGASRRTFGTVIEKKVCVLIDTSGSMVSHMDDLKKDLVALIWEQFRRMKFNLIRFSGDIEPWRPVAVEPSDSNCHDAVRWVNSFVPAGNSCTLEALMAAFQDKRLEAIYLLTDGKPDTSTSKILGDVAEINTIRRVKINTISFNCDDETANTFLRQLAAMSRGRYHRVFAGMDGDLAVHRLLEEGFKDTDFPVLPTFESDDLLLLTSEIEKARHYLAQSRSFRELFQDTPKPHEKDPVKHSRCLAQPVSVGKS